MNSTCRTFLSIWGISFIVVAIAGTVYAVLPHVTGQAVIAAGAATVNGESVAIMQRPVRSTWNSNVVSGGGRGVPNRWLWESLELRMVPADEQRGDKFDHSRYWLAVDATKPHHLVFERPDGSRTDPMRVEWESCGAWTNDGRAIEFHSGMSSFIGRTLTFPPQRIWDRGAWLLFSRHLGTAALVCSLLCVFIARLAYTWRAMVRPLPPHLCPSCRYDMRCTPSLRCPECGTSRSPE